MKRIPASLLVLILLAGCDWTHKRDDTPKPHLAVASSFVDVVADNSAITTTSGSSGRLRAQIESGAPIDAFISARASDIDDLIEKKFIVADSRIEVCRNRLVVVSTPKFARQLRTLDDLRLARRIAIGRPDSVPAGHYAMQAIRASGLGEALSEKFIHTSNVRQALDFVDRGEADVAIVYQSDVPASRAVLLIDESSHDQIVYVGGVVSNSKHAEAARELLKFIRADANKLEQHGFIAFDPTVNSPSTRPLTRLSTRLSSTALRSP